MDFSVREARREDAEAIAGLINGLARELGATSSVMSRDKIRADFFDVEKGLCLHVAEAKGVVVGYALHHIGYESSQASKGRYLSDLYVVRMARRRGVASALLARVAKIAADEGGTFIWWIGKDVAGEARPLYKKFANLSATVTSYAVAHPSFDSLVTADKA